MITNSFYSSFKGHGWAASWLPEAESRVITDRSCRVQSCGFSQIALVPACPYYLATPHTVHDTATESLIEKTAVAYVTFGF